MRKVRYYFFSMAILFLFPVWLMSTASAVTITQIHAPGDLSDATTLNFDAFASYTDATGLFLSEGVDFIPEGNSVIIQDFSNTPITPSSLNNVLVAAPAPNDHSVSLDVIFDSPTFMVGAYLGNDQFNGTLYESERFELEIFDVSNQSLGLVSINSNLNLAVDQYLGLESDMSFSRARFTHFSIEQNTYALSVILDDLSFRSTSKVPAPPSILLVGLGMLGLTVSIRKKTKRTRADG